MDLYPYKKRLLSEIVGEKDTEFGTIDGENPLKKRLRQKKVLLILDDVNTFEQLEALAGEPNWFGFGSRVIITTRDRHLLAFHGVERQYKVQPLNHTDALQLLSHKAFKQDNVRPSYTDILNQAVTYASGIPFALEVIGSPLFGRSVDECRKALDQFKSIPNDDILKILSVTLDGLREKEKTIFLDIACFFNGYGLAMVQNMLRLHYGCVVDDDIILLFDKSLISISSDGKVTLPPLIEDMGKEIARRESPTKSQKRRTLRSFVEFLLDFKEIMNPHRVRAVSQPSESVREDLLTQVMLERQRRDFQAKTMRRLAGLLLSDFQVILEISQMVFQAETMWRLVGLVSSVVGLLCYALSSFNRLIGGWTSFKLFIYVLLSLGICTVKTILTFHTTCSAQKLHVLCGFDDHFSVLILIRQGRERET